MSTADAAISTVNEPAIESANSRIYLLQEVIYNNPGTGKTVALGMSFSRS